MPSLTYIRIVKGFEKHFSFTFWFKGGGCSLFSCWSHNRFMWSFGFLFAWWVYSLYIHVKRSLFDTSAKSDDALDRWSNTRILFLIPRKFQKHNAASFIHSGACRSSERAPGVTARVMSVIDLCSKFWER